MPRNVYRFGAGEADGHADQKALLGGKGANLAEMTNLGIPVPAGFTITTDVCAQFAREGAFTDKLRDKVAATLAWVGELVGATFGDPANPLLVSVRSGAPVSMPGMMDTILNLGLNDETVKGLAEQSADPRFAYDCYRRFVAMYGTVVMGVAPDSDRDLNPFDQLLEAKKEERHVERDVDLSADDLRSLVTDYKIEILRRTNTSFPEDPAAQLWGAIGAVFASWDTPRARIYRQMHDIPDTMGTAVNVQAMVFGNLGDDCATGVCFTRDPATGDKQLYGEFLVNAQGEDVVAGTRTPEPIAELERVLPQAFGELSAVCERLERHYKDVQDLEFTVQRGKLWMLQTRTGKRAGRAMVRVAVDMVREGLIDERTAICRVEPTKLDELLHPTIDPAQRPEPIARGLNASPGAAIGKVVFTAADAEKAVEQGQKVILVRVETSPEDIGGMKSAAGVLTARGGMTSHAAVVARGLGKACVAGCSQIQVDLARERFTAGERVIKKGDLITLDGSTGEVFAGSAALVPARLDEDYEQFMTWVDDARRLKVRTNADTANDSRTARAFGAEGIGLCRTEHMFFAPERIVAVREMILADSVEDRRAALEKILPMQRSDFLAIFREMDGLPVTIRLLDPPLHEFLPNTAQEVAEVARSLGVPADRVGAEVKRLREVNPMLGHRGCRLAISYPEIYETQARAIAEAVVEAKGAGIKVKPEIMIPFVAVARELEVLRALVKRTVDDILGAAELEQRYQIGTMIELPRACLAGDDIAEHADFFSFGTNDLTQTTFGLSRDDAGTFLPEYVDGGFVAKNPFVALDRAGVGALIRIGVEKGRAKKTKLKIGICGEHGGEPSSVEFCHVEGFDYVSCSPFRVPIARVAAAQAALRGETRGR